MSIFQTYRAIAPPLRAERWFGAAGFHFGMPWPWEDAPGAVSVVDADGHESRPLVCALAPRSDGAATVVVWSDPDPIDVTVVAPTFARTSAAARGARVLSDARVSVARSRSLLAELLEPGGDHVTRVLIGGGPGTLFVEFCVPASAIDGYRPHILTALGTWRWG